MIWQYYMTFQYPNLSFVVALWTNLFPQQSSLCTSRALWVVAWDWICNTCWTCLVVARLTTPVVPELGDDVVIKFNSYVNNGVPPHPYQIQSNNTWVNPGFKYNKLVFTPPWIQYTSSLPKNTNIKPNQIHIFQNCLFSLLYGKPAPRAECQHPEERHGQPASTDI